MNFAIKAIVTGLVLVAGVAVAKDGVQDPTVKARMDLMGIQGQNAKILGEMAGGETPFDATAAEAAKVTLIGTSAEIAARFQTQASDPVSEALPEIWLNWTDFTAKADDLATVVAAVDTTTLEGVQAGMGKIGEACKACHSTFRMKKP
ncbi:MAG: cytochrome c [Pseudorhodobacter sp.]|nr:cytochrome c [Pseudorhodobacter sp.]